MKNTIKSLATLGMITILTIGSVYSYAQTSNSYITVKGVIKDSKTKQKVIFASISVPATNIGTVSNSDGEFTLKVQKSTNASEFEISHLGYINKKVSLSESTAGDQIFYVDPYSVQLDELVVKPIDPRSVVLRAISKIEDNYSNAPNMLTGFYRETIKQRRDYLSISEAIVDAYKASYSNSFDNDRVRIFKGRNSSNVKKIDTLSVKLVGGPSALILLDIVRNPDVLISREGIDNYDYKYLDMVNIDGKTNYVIGFEPATTLDFPLYFGKLYISTEKLAITMAEFSLDLKDEVKTVQCFVKQKPLGLRFVPLSTSFLVVYKEQDGRFYINYVRNEIKFSCSWKKRLFKNNYTVMSEMAITERKTVNIEKFSAKESFKLNSVLADKVNDYFDENYWGEYNIIVPDESIQSAINKFNKRLRKQ